MSTSVETSVAVVGANVHAATLRRRAVKGGVLLMGTRLASQVFVWAVSLLVARLLLPLDYGIMTSGMIFVGFADLLAEAGVGKALVQKKDLHPSDLAQSFTLSLLLSAFLVTLLFFAAPPAAAFLAEPELVDFLRVLALGLLLVPFKTVPLALLDRGLFLGKQSAVILGAAVVQSGLVLGLAASGFGYWALASGALASRVMETVILMYLSGWRPCLALPGREARGILSFGFHVTLSSLLWFVYSNSDFAIVAKLAGPAALGIYSLAFQLISLPVHKLTAKVNQIVYPVYCRLQSDPERLRDWYLRLTVLLGLVGLPMIMGMALVAADGILVVLGEKWLPAVLPFRLLSVAGALLIYSASLGPLFNALGRPDVNLKFTALCTLLFPLGFVAAGMAYGLIGICLVWLVLYPLLVAGLIWATRNLTGIAPLALVRAQLPVAGAVVFMTAVVLAVQLAMADVEPAVVRLLVSISAGAAAYAGILLCLARRTVLADVGALWRELTSASGGR